MLWSRTSGAWLDLDLLHSRPRTAFYPSNYVPLWTGSLHHDDEEAHRQVLKGEESLVTTDWN